MPEEKIKPRDRILAGLEERDRMMKKVILSYVRDAEATVALSLQNVTTVERIMSPGRRQQLNEEYAESKKEGLAALDFVGDPKFKDQVEAQFKKLDETLLSEGIKNE